MKYSPFNDDVASSAAAKAAAASQQPVPDEFICPLTLEIMATPMMTRSGHSYERDAILSWLEEHHQCPLTRRYLGLSDIVINAALMVKIQKWKVEHGLALEEDDDQQEHKDDNANYWPEHKIICAFVPSKDLIHALEERTHCSKSQTIARILRKRAQLLTTVSSPAPAVRSA